MITIESPAFYADMMRQAHTLITGTTGAGKSVALAGMIARLAAESPAAAQLSLIDPKRVELSPWRNLPHCTRYAAEYTAIDAAITADHAEMLQRYADMEKRGESRFSGPDRYIIIDEWVDIKLFCARDTIRAVEHIASLGRAAGIHLILCTQRPTKDTLTPLLKDNLPCKLILRTESAQQSRYITGTGGAEVLPIGTGLYYTPATPGTWHRVNIPLFSPDTRRAILEHYSGTESRPKPRFWPFGGIFSRA